MRIRRQARGVEKQQHMRDTEGPLGLSYDALKIIVAAAIGILLEAVQIQSENLGAYETRRTTSVFRLTPPGRYEQRSDLLP